jgi:pimeloyl-ACP methyl ester carboxylesterase
LSAPVVLLAGTHADEGWWKPGTSFYQAMIAAGLSPVSPVEPFQWSHDIDGTLLDYVFGRAHRDWMAAGHALSWYAHSQLPPLADGTYQRVSIIAHSHGGQVALYAAYYGLLVDCLVTVGTPVRRDMQRIASQGRGNIRFWAHLYGDGRDFWQVLGGRTLNRRMVLADQNIHEPATHRGLLNPNVWTERGWWNLLK